jgi:hypothetical protein
VSYFLKLIIKNDVVGFIEVLDVAESRDVGKFRIVSIRSIDAAEKLLPCVEYVNGALLVLVVQDVVTIAGGK